MTPALLIAILVALAIVLVGLSWAIGKELRSRRTLAGHRAKPADKKSSLKNQTRSAKRTVREPAVDDPATEDRLPRSIGRKRQILPINGAGGGTAPAEPLLASGAYASCEEKLELAFNSYSHGRISLDTYEGMVRTEGERAKRLRAELRARELAGNKTHEELDSFREEIEAIEVAVQWCLDWAEDLRKSEKATRDQAD